MLLSTWVYFRVPENFVLGVQRGNGLVSYSKGNKLLSGTEHLACLYTWVERGSVRL